MLTVKELKSVPHPGLSSRQTDPELVHSIFSVRCTPCSVSMNNSENKTKVWREKWDCSLDKVWTGCREGMEPVCCAWEVTRNFRDRIEGRRDDELEERGVSNLGEWLHDHITAFKTHGIIKKLTKDLTDTSPKKIHRWYINLWKDAPHHMAWRI